MNKFSFAVFEGQKNAGKFGKLLVKVLREKFTFFGEYLSLPQLCLFFLKNTKND
jgi:hypothetical protein